jgi:transcriptional regulator with XRE-family HTH domain
MSVLSERLKSARDHKNLKQTQVKERTGINNKTLSGYENGVSIPDPDTLTRLADLYEVSTDYLYGRTNDPRLRVDGMPFLNEKDENDIAKRMKQIREDLKKGSDGESIAFYGEPLSPEATESLLQSLEFIERQTKLINKKYIPKSRRQE